MGTCRPSHVFSLLLLGYRRFLPYLSSVFLKSPPYIFILVISGRAIEAVYGLFSFSTKKERVGY